MRSPLAWILLLLVAASPQQTAKPLPPPAGIDLEAYGKLPLPHRWVTYRESVEKNKQLVGNWVHFLEQRRDFEMLEQIAVFEGFQMLFQKGQPGEILYRLKAPQWMRVALWNIKQKDSHSVEAATNPLESNPRLFMGWAKKHPEVKRLGGAALLEKLKAYEPLPATGQLPPLDPQTVILPILDAPRNLPTLAPGEEFRKNTRYRYQVLRAIRAISVAGVFDEPYRGKLLRLTRHADPEVRRTAMMEFTEFSGPKVPWSELLAMSRNKDLAAADRRAAFLAATYSPHPDVYLGLHEVLTDSTHPAFEAALSRAPALGDGYTYEVLRALPTGELSDEVLKRIARTTVTLGRARDQRQQNGSGSPAETLLYRVAWAAYKKDPQSAALLAWTRKRVAQRLAHPKAKVALTKALRKPPSNRVPKHLHEWMIAESQRMLAPQTKK